MRRRAGGLKASVGSIDDVVRDMAASRAVWWHAAIATLFVLIILDMVLKPF